MAIVLICINAACWTCHFFVVVYCHRRLQPPLTHTHTHRQRVWPTIWLQYCNHGFCVYEKNRKHPRITIDQPWIHREIHHFAAQFWHLSLGSVSHCKEMAPVYVLRGGPFERFLYFDAETYWRVGSCEYKDQDPAEIGQRFLRCVKGDYIFFMIDGI